MRVDLTLRDLPITDVAAAAARGEALGFDTVAVTETSGSPFVAAALAAIATRNCRVGTGIALGLPRTPMDLAYAAWDLQALSGGRFALGLGSQVRAHVERRYGAAWDRPAARMREQVLALRAIFDAWEHGTDLDFRGEFWTHTLMPPNFRPAPHPHPRPPVLLAAVRERMLEVAGEVADGFLGHALQTADSLAQITLPALERGLERGGRRREDLQVTVGMFVATSDAEWEDARRRVAFYGSTPGYRHILDLHGLGPLHERLHTLSREDGWARMPGLVDDDTLALFAVRGDDPAAAAAEIRVRVGGVADRVAFAGEAPDLERWAQIPQRCAERPAATVPLAMTRIFSGIQPTGRKHLGNHIGAIRQYVDGQDRGEAVYCIVDLHATTVAYEPAELRARVLDTTALLLAAGVDPERCVLFRQSDVREHAELTWLLTSVTAVGELNRMHQFKDKSSRQRELVGAGILFYPVLMAADVLAYRTDVVPVGEDQREHVELTRECARRFNARFAPEDEVLVVPEHRIPPVGARIMDLQEPTRKMSTSVGGDEGRVYVLDDDSAILKKFKRAVTDSENEIRVGADKPGVTNLVEILAAARGCSVDEALASLADARGYGDLKVAAAEAVIAMLRPVRERYEALRADEDALEATLAAGADKARVIAQDTLADVRAVMGVGARP